MAETLHCLSANSWPPRILREGGQLLVRLPKYDAHGINVYEHSFPATQEHLDVLRGSVPRHLLLWCALEQICAEAGRRVSDPASIKKRLVPEPSQQRARRALDVVLLDPEADVERYFASEDVDTQRLIAHGADPELLCEGALFAALGETPSAEWNWRLVEEEQARRRGDVLGVVRGGRLQSIALRLWGRVSRLL